MRNKLQVLPYNTVQGYGFGSLNIVRQWRKWCVLMAIMEKEGSSGKLSDQSEVLLNL